MTVTDLPTSGVSYNFARVLTRHYGKLYVLCMAIVIVLCGVSVGQYQFMMQQTEQTDYDWNVAEAEQSQLRDALVWARRERDRGSDEDEDDNVDERSEKRSSMTLVYQHLDLSSRDSIFTPENLKAMCEVENILLEDDDFPKFCYNGSSPLGYTYSKKGACARQELSIVSLFYLAWSPWNEAYSPASETYAFAGSSKGTLGSMQLYRGIPVLDGVPPDAPTDEADLYDGHRRKCDKLSNRYVENRTKQLIDLVDQSDAMRSALGFFLAADVEDRDESDITRSVLTVAGKPLDGYDDEDDRKEEQRAKYREFFEKMDLKFFEYFDLLDTNMRSGYRTDKPPVNGVYPSVASKDQVDVRWGAPWSNYEFTRMINSDLMWVIGSVTFVFFYVTWHTYSLWLSSMAMFQIFMSLPLAFFFYRVVGQIDYFVQLHILTIFLVLGVGADDVFVYVDAWKQGCARSDLGTQFRRVLFTWSHTAQSVFNTSFTTASAFFATALNPVMPISSFGIYAALAIVMNYLLTITLFPTVVLIWENELRWCWAKVMRKEIERVPWGLDANEIAMVPAADTVREKGTVMSVDVLPSGTGTQTSLAGALVGPTPGDAEGTAAAAVPVKEVPVDLDGATSVEVAPASEPALLPATKVNGVAEEEVARAADAQAVDARPVHADGAATGPARDLSAKSEIDDTVVVGSGGTDVDETVPGSGATNADGATTGPAHADGTAAGPAPEPAAFAKPDEQLRPAEAFFRRYYAPMLNWALPCYPGLKPVSLGLVLTFLGLGVAGVYFALQLEPPTEEEQWFTADHMLTGFDEINRRRFLSGAEDEYADMAIVLGILGISRPNFVRWNPDENRGTAVFDDSLDITTHKAQKAVEELCEEMRKAPCDLSSCRGGFGKLVRPDTLECFIEDFDRWYVREKWNETERGPFKGSKDRPEGDSFLDDLKDFAQAGEETSSQVGFIDGKLKYAEIRFTGTMLGYQPYVTTNEYYTKIHDTLNKTVTAIEEGDKLGHKPFVYAGRHFVWVVTEESLVSGVLQGFAICFPVAFVVLVLATGSPLISTFAIIAIALIVGTTLGFCQAVMGWALGVAESISSTIVIGFSVDYVVHLGHAYCESAHTSREGKTSDALTQMGITVVAGAVTTLGSGLFMWACQMTFFTKMAVLITAVIALSISYALFFFMPLLALWGPQGEIQSITALVQKARRNDPRSVWPCTRHRDRPHEVG